MAPLKECNRTCAFYQNTRRALPDVVCLRPRVQIRQVLFVCSRAMVTTAIAEEVSAVSSAEEQLEHQSACCLAEPHLLSCASGGLLGEES